MKRPFKQETGYRLLEGESMNTEILTEHGKLTREDIPSF
jgi:hypothetical protein